MLDACLLPIETGMTSWPHLRVSAAQAVRLARVTRRRAGTTSLAPMSSTFCGSIRFRLASSRTVVP